MNVHQKVVLLIVIWANMVSCAGTRKTRPHWVDHLPRRSGWMYAVGYAPRYLNPADAWRKAEENARENLAKAVQTRIEGLEMWYSDPSLGPVRREATRQATDVVVPNAQVLERYFDEDEGLYYVLVGIELKHAGKLVGRGPKRTRADTKDIRKAASKAFEELERKLRQQ